VAGCGGLAGALDAVHDDQARGSGGVVGQAAVVVVVVMFGGFVGRGARAGGGGGGGGGGGEGARAFLGLGVILAAGAIVDVQGGVISEFREGVLNAIVVPRGPGAVCAEVVLHDSDGGGWVEVATRALRLIEVVKWLEITCGLGLEACVAVQPGRHCARKGRSQIVKLRNHY